MAGTAPTPGARGTGPGQPGTDSGQPGAEGSATNHPAGVIPPQALDCFDGTGGVRLDTLSRPAVINMWASYCTPCRVELPNLEAFAKAAGSSVAVIGVDTADGRSSAQSVITDLRLSYPMIFDPDQRVYAATAGRGLPATLFVAPGGKVQHVYESGTVLDQASLNALVAKYLGVTVHG